MKSEYILLYDFKYENYKFKKKRLMNVLSTADYLYISGTLKDTFKYNDELYSGFGNDVYHTFFYRFVDELSRRTNQDKIPLKYKIVELEDSVASEIRIIIRCPKGSKHMGFVKKATKLWEQNPSIDITGFWDVKRSEEMDLDFLDLKWKGGIH